MLQFTKLEKKGYFKAFQSQIMLLKILDAQAWSCRVFWFSFPWVLVCLISLSLLYTPIPPFGMETFTLCPCILEVYNMGF